MLLRTDKTNERWEVWASFFAVNNLIKQHANLRRQRSGERCLVNGIEHGRRSRQISISINQIYLDNAAKELILRS
jgi:hypothetical protein